VAAVTFLPLTEDIAPQWDAFVTRHEQGWVWQLSTWIAYLVAAGRDDRSVAAVSQDGELHGITPAFAVPDPHDPWPLPLGIAKAMPGCWRGQPQWDRTEVGFETRVIDLSLPLADLWRDLRKSSHALIHRAQEAYGVERGRGVDGLRACYLLRPDLPQLNAGQWVCLAKLERDGILRVYEARDAIGDIVGAVGIYAWKGWSYYGHGRSLDALQLPVGGVSHLLQWHVIQTLQAEHWPHYETGWAARPDDSDKDKAIAHFKSGLGGLPWWIPTIRIASDTMVG
jgi:hypothetical protein